MRIPLAYAVTSMLAATILAQSPDPLAQARARLHKALIANAAQPAGAFAARWGPAANPAAQQQNANAGNVIVMLGGMGGSHQPGAATGTWTPGLLHLGYDDNTELAFAGRRMIAKDATESWCLRREVTADGAPLPFVPDVQYLLQQLARQDSAVVHQEVGSRDDRPVEILTLTLSADQVTDAMWGGLMPKPGAGFGGMAIRAAAGGGAPKAVVPKPEATVDIAIVLDPATAMLHAITVRCYQKQDPRMNRAVFAAGAGAVVQVAGAAGGNDDSDDDEADAKVDKNAPMEFKDGLPVRSRKKMTVWDYSIELKDLGTAKPPELPAEAKALLGLQ